MSNAPHSGPPYGLNEQQAERLEELLADRAVFGLDSEDEANELKHLLAAAGNPDVQKVDLLAASVATLQAPTAEPPPARLRDWVLDRVPEPAEPLNTKASGTSSLSGGAAIDPAQMSWKLVAFAVAAGLLVSLMINNLRPGPTLSQQRIALLESSDAAVQVAWAPQQDALLTAGLEGDSAYGDVVWSDATQTGYMRFRGLKPNDPAVEQYQLWVFDEARNAEHPVDGGVFDIAATGDGEAIVPINAKLPITKATLFAITVEKPGGVVVSDRSRLPLLAQR